MLDNSQTVTRVLLPFTFTLFYFLLVVNCETYYYSVFHSPKIFKPFPAMRWFFQYCCTLIRTRQTPIRVWLYTGSHINSVYSLLHISRCSHKNVPSPQENIYLSFTKLSPNYFLTSSHHPFHIWVYPFASQPSSTDHTWQYHSQLYISSHLTNRWCNSQRS